jgi:hypothetical protein
LMLSPAIIPCCDGGAEEGGSALYGLGGAEGWLSDYLTG